METSIHNPEIKTQNLPRAPDAPAARKAGALDHLLDVCFQRLKGVPRSFAEANYSLQMLSILRELGWHKSVRARKPVAAEGLAVPWYTYAALEWLAPRVRPTDRVFEYGAGNSTVWFGRHSKQVVSVEHDARWLAEVRSMAGANVTLLLRTPHPEELAANGNSPYVTAINEFPPASFDIIVIDGVERVACAALAPARLKSDGSIIFDDSSRPASQPGIECLHQQGFGRLDFYGFTTQVGVRKCTSIFSRFGTRWTQENVPLVYQGW
jgi:hypothetical protein